MQTVARKLFPSLLVMAAAVSSPCSAVAEPMEPASEVPAGPLLEWSDPQGLVPTKLLTLVTAELATMAQAMGVEMRLGTTGAAQPAGRHHYQVSVMRAPKPHWRLREDVMAAAPVADGYRGTIYLFLEQVRHTLGHLADSDSSERAREHIELATALARIIAHEVVHVVAPDHPHATSGLMVAKLRRGPLTKRKARVDPACARAFRDALTVD